MLKHTDAPERIRHFPVRFHKHTAPYTTLRGTNSSPRLTRFPSGPSRHSNPTSITKTPLDPRFVKMQRPATPYNDPKVQGPRAQILASGKNSDLLKMMQQNTVNKTGLHPSGVQYVASFGLPRIKMDAVRRAH